MFERSPSAMVQDAYRAGTVTVADVVQAYLDRIESIDRSGVELNSIVTLSPHASEDAAKLDASFAETGQFFGPLHGVPVVVKDQIEVGGMPMTSTAHGSTSFWKPAEQVACGGWRNN